MNVSKLIIAAVAASLSFGTFAESMDKKAEVKKIAKHEKAVKKIAEAEPMSQKEQNVRRIAKQEVEKAKKLAKKGSVNKIS